MLPGFDRTRTYDRLPMPYADLEAQRAYQREWKARRRAEWLDGRTCEHCGASDPLQVHHRDPAQKVSHKLWSWSAERRDAELAKCIVLCEACHVEHHGHVPQHGTKTRYAKGCRCEVCVEGHRAWLADLPRRRATWPSTRRAAHSGGVISSR